MLKTSDFSRVCSTIENVDVSYSRHDIYLVFTEKKSKFSLNFILGSEINVYLKEIERVLSQSQTI